MCPVGRGLPRFTAYASLGCRWGASRPHLEPGLVADKADIEVFAADRFVLGYYYSETRREGSACY